MQGLTPAQLEEIRAFVQKHHKFGYVPQEDRVTEYPYMIKYIDVVYDSRDQTYWCVSFRGGINGVTFRTNHFALTGPPKGWKYNNLYDLCMAYLKGEFVPKDEAFYSKQSFPEIIVREALMLDCHDNGVWFIKDRFKGKEGEIIFGAGLDGKLAAYEYLYRNQRYDIA